MSTLSDVQALYGSVRDTWAKSQAHVVSHLVIGLVVFVACKSTLPDVSFPRLDAKQIAENEWFKLAKETGVIYISLVVPFIVAAAYAAVLRIVGQWLAAAMALVFQPITPRNLYRLVSPTILEPLALTLRRPDFELSDLLAKSSELSLKYQSKKNEHWESYQQSLTRLTKNAQVYLGDFSVFLVLWIVLFKLMPPAAWTHTNQGQFWPVTIVLIGLTWFAWFRVSRVLAFMPTLHLMYVSTMLRTDPDMRSVFEVPDENLTDVRKRLQELLSVEAERTNHAPSLRRFVRHRLGCSEPTDKQKVAGVATGFPLPSLYQQGFRFSRDEGRQREYDDEWFWDYCAYLYYRLHSRLSQLAKALWQLGRYVVTGAP